VAGEQVTGCWEWCRTARCTIWGTPAKHY